MVHSGFSSPMNTTSALPLPASTTAPSLVPPSADSTDQTLTKTPIKPTINLDSAEVSSPASVHSETHIHNDSNSTSTLSPTPVQPVINGRTSGRKRTPKSCDCCGPNSKGHNVQIPGRGRGRARGRPRSRGRGNNLEDTPKRTVGGLLTQVLTFDLTNDNLGEAESIVMGADSPSQNSVQLHIPKQDGLILNCTSTEATDPQNKERHMGKEGVCSNEVENKVLDEIEGVVGQSCQVMGPNVSTTTAEIKRKIEDNNSFSFLTNVQVSLVANKQAKLEHKEHTELESTSQNGHLKQSKNGIESINKENSIGVTQVKNIPLQIDTNSEDTSALDWILIDQIPDTSDSIPLTLLNGSTITAPTDNSRDIIFMELEASRPAAVPPSSHGPVSLCLCPCALRDHRLYCRSGTWDKVDQTEDTGEEHLNDKTHTHEVAESECLEQLVCMVHEFLESFYVKYGSFIPLSETDVVEHLKMNGISDLNKKGLDITKEVSRYRAGLATAPVAGFMVAHNKHMLSLEDLGTLEEQNWLNDQLLSRFTISSVVVSSVATAALGQTDGNVAAFLHSFRLPYSHTRTESYASATHTGGKIINMYGELLMEATEQKVHFFNSFFHKQLVAKGYEGVKRWTKKVDLFSKWLVLIPIHLEIHWSLVTVSIATKTINYYDSQGIVFRHTTENIMKYLLSEAKEKKQAAFQKGWRITIIKGIPQQKNDSDCGAFVLEYCRCLSMKQPFRFRQEDMPRIRKRIYKELCECRLDV